MFNLIFFGALFLIIIASTIISFFRGFIKSVAGFVEYILSFVVAYTLAPVGAKLVKMVPIIKNLITDVQMPAIDESATSTQKMIEMVKYIALTGLNNNNETIKQIANNYLAEILSIAIAFVVLFLVTIVILKILVAIINKIATVPGIKQLNRLLGGIFGLMIGFFITW